MSEASPYRHLRRGREKRVNGPGAERNRRTVLTFRRTAALATSALAMLGVSLVTLGCGGARGADTSQAGLAGLAPGTTTLRIANHVGAPNELDRITIAVDGENVPLTSLPPEGAAPATIGALRLKPGPHHIAVRAKARAPNSEVLVVGAQQPFHLSRGPSAITIDVRSAAADRPNEAPVTLRTARERSATIAVSLSILGGVMAPEIGAAPPDEKDERCGALLPIPRALCRAAVDLDEATRKNDVVAALCVRDKIAEMRKLAIIGESGLGDSPALAEAQVAQLAKQVEQCVGDVVASPASDGLTVKRRP
jgi:hypothetical protein